ncbi:MAG TPA: SWIM zinc finger family protein [Reyranella sp.]|nr:SWIM zinc finger family protein [Reyranella sp.]
MRYYDFYDEWPRTMTVAERRQQAREDMARLGKRKRGTPVIIEGSKIATSFWGKAWCSNLERYSDYASRLPRGRSYVRSGQVVDLQIAAGKVVALVSGTELYETTITIAPVKSPQWKAICRDCAGSIDSVVELLQGRLAQGVMDRVCRAGDGLFPAPREIKLSCSCPDSARMCKHVAAVLYGVGARLDQQPQLLFVLRGVDQNELIAGAGQGLAAGSAPASAKVLQDDDMAALFGLEMADEESSEASASAKPKPARRMKKAGAAKRQVARSSAASVGDDAGSRVTRGKTIVRTRKRARAVP